MNYVQVYNDGNSPNHTQTNLNPTVTNMNMDTNTKRNSLSNTNLSQRRVSFQVEVMSPEEKELRRGPELTRICNRHDRTKFPEFIRMHIYENQRYSFFITLIS